MQGKKNITINDLAKALNTSSSTVSRALKDHPKISQSMKLKVKETAIKLGYVQSIQASIQKGFNNHTLGIIVPSLSETKYSTLIESAQKILKNEGFTVVVSCTSNSTEQEEKILQLFKNLNIRGVISSLTSENKNPKYYHTFIKDTPLILVDRVGIEIPCKKIMTDHFQVGFRSVQHLLNIGCHNIAHIGGNINCPLSKQISTGYKTALRQSGKIANPKLEVFSDQLHTDIMKATELIYSQKIKPDAILVDEIMAAQKLVSILQTRKIKIPDDVAIIAIGDEKDYSFYSPSLTTIQIPYEKIGKRAAQLLLDEIENEGRVQKDEILVEPFHLNIRNSTLKS
ncbi:MAG: LacI family DNA-binding transcriptional regulator [Salinivirgaceae bacterium]|jgi:LacI family transcriptional regulator|nr:LacI family DNA-binding transcriptional regulator [Salinivirgaceae bacterium]